MRSSKSAMITDHLRLPSFCRTISCAFSHKGNASRSRPRPLCVIATVRLREALPLWEKAQDMVRQKLGSRRWSVIMADLDDLIRVA